MEKMKRIAALGLILASAAAFAAFPGDDKQDMDRFFKAKELVFNRDWSKARTDLESYLKDFRAGRMRDEALYWLAQSLDRLSRGEKSREAVVRLKKAAADHLRNLIETCPDSLWKNDARTLRVEIASTLVLLGEESYKSVIDEAVRTQGRDGRDIKLLALNSLVELDPATALSILRRTLSSELDAEVRLRAVHLLARFTEPEISKLLAEIARADKDERVRSRAAALAEQVRQQQIPVLLRYYIYGARLLDESLYSKFPEKKVLTFSLPRSKEGDVQSLLGKAAGVFEGKLSVPVGSTTGTLLPPFIFDPDSVTIIHRAADYQLWIDPSALKIASDNIGGEVRFTHRATGEKYTEPFRVDRSGAKLLVMRSGGNISLLVFQFDERPAFGEGPEAPKTVETPDASGYGRLKVSSTVTLDEGVKVYTERTDYGLRDFEKSLIDLENAKAEIPSRDLVRQSSDDNWVLIGDLFYLKDQKKLVGFGSMLINPDREVVAEGLIEVRAGDPAGFQLLSGRTYEKNRRVITASEERRTRPFYPTRFVSHLGWEVLTTRNSIDPTATAEKTDFGLARAVRTHGGRDWVLIGQIMSLNKQRKFLARQAALLSSDGTIVHAAELQVSVDNPEDHAVVKKGP